MDPEPLQPTSSKPVAHHVAEVRDMSTHPEVCCGRKRKNWRGFRNLFVFALLLVLVGLGFYAWLMCSWFDTGHANSEVTGLIALSGAEVRALEISSDEIVSKKVDENILDRDHATYSEVVQRFRKAKVDYWKNAPDIDRFGQDGASLKYWCLAPGENGRPVILEISMARGAKMTVRRLSESSGLERVPANEFTRIAEKNPYLVMRGERAYFAFKGKGRLPAVTLAPQKGKALIPSQVEFGDLYTVFTDMKIPSPDFHYDVFFEVKGGSPILKVATVRFGEAVPYGKFFLKVADHYGLSENEEMAIDAVLKLGRVKVVSADAQSKR